MVADLRDRVGEILPHGGVRVRSGDVIESRSVLTSGALDDALAALTTACDQPVLTRGQSRSLSVAIGIALGRATADDRQLIEAAEDDLERAVAHAALPNDIRRLGEQLTQAVARDELEVHYQPKLRVRRQEIDSVEALIRWRHPHRGLVYPGDFIAAAERVQVIGALTLWTIARVIEDQRTLRAAGHDVRIFVNISGQLLSDDAFVNGAAKLIAESDASIGFEVTETSVIRDPTRAIANLQRLADVGIRIAIDDYGAGLSSLAYLKQLPARELKIDKLFVTQLTSSNRDPLIVRSTIDLAHALDMEVVAEGVETHAAMALLTVMGCDIVQGFLISRPVPLPALLQFLAASTHPSTAERSLASMTRLAGVWKRA